MMPRVKRKVPYIRVCRRCINNFNTYKKWKRFCLNCEKPKGRPKQNIYPLY